MYRKQLTETKTSRFSAWGHTFELVISPVYNSDGEYYGRITQRNDITDELLVEQEIDDIVAVAKSGDLNQRINLQGKEGFFKQLVGASMI